MTIADADAVLVAVGTGGLILSVITAITATVRGRLSRIEEGIAGVSGRLDAFATRLDGISEQVARLQGRNEEQDRQRAIRQSA